MHVLNHTVLFCFTCERAFNDTEEKVQHMCKNVPCILDDVEDDNEAESKLFENVACESPDADDYINRCKEYKTELFDISAASEKTFEKVKEENDLSAEGKLCCTSYIRIYGSNTEIAFFRCKSTKTVK